MPVSPGNKLGPYEIVASLGVGGMGEVYRARDSKLQRDVAIKVLPAALADDAQYMARFEREAQVLAALNHPNIATVYGIEQGALVMELVEGADLRGPLPLEDAIPIARQIAVGLEAAHERGIVHRDLKPANIKVTPAGVVKLLDFGLAKSTGDLAASAPGGSPTMSPTLSLALTQAGTILGTAAYMSPEQARGKPVDKRADIWAFGVVFYELLTGRQLFGGETVTDTLASVVKDMPDLSKLPASTPGHVRRLIERCLRKDPNTRLRDIGEARVSLDEPELAAPPEGVVPPAEARANWLPWVVAAGATLAAMGLGYVAYRHTTEEPRHLVKMSVSPPEKATHPPHDARPAISPDGRHIAFTANINGKASLWVRDLDALDARPLPGTDGANQPFWSPDSGFIGFFAKDKLLKIDLRGGPPLTICDGIVQGRGGAWSASGTIVFGTNASGLFRVPAAGGTAAPLTTLDKSLKERTHWYPWFLPDGRHFLYTASPEGQGQSVVYVAEVDAKGAARSRRKVVAANSQAAYAPPGYLLFLRERTLLAQPFDARRGETTGEAVPVAEQVDHAGGSVSGSFTISQNGFLAYISVEDASAQISWFDRAGKEIGKVGAPGSYGNLRLSPDEKRIAFERNDPESRTPDIWVTDLVRGVTSRLTFDPAADAVPLWSADGLRILYTTKRSGHYDLYIQAATGGGQEETLLTLGARNAWGTSWSQDERFVMYTAGAPGEKTGFDLWIAPQFGNRKPYPYLQTQFDEVNGVFSPDGRWVAYASNESGRYETYVQAFPVSGAKFQVSTGGGAEPVWRRDGAELFYVTADRNLMAAPVKAGATFEAGVPKPLFRIPFTQRSSLSDQYTYTVSNDGQRFLIAAAISGEKATPITVVLNWQVRKN